MDKLHPQAELLLAYADGQLSDDQKVKVEALLSTDPEAIAFIDKLSISDLPYQKSFDVMIENKTPIDSDLHSSRSSNSIEKRSKNKSVWFWPASLVASLMLGLGIGYAVFLSKYENHDNWIVQVADYHLLYGRDTVKEVQLNDKQVLKLKQKLGNALNSDFTIPDLSSNKLVFKRGQILDREGRALIQLVYLPEQGSPVALCLLRTELPDSLPTKGESRGMPYVNWSKNGISYVIIGNIDSQNLEAAALNAVSQIEG